MYKKEKNQGKNEKGKTMEKMALMSPFFQYYETMPSRVSKEFTGENQLQALIEIMYQQLRAASNDDECEPVIEKRQRIADGALNKS